MPKRLDGRGYKKPCPRHSKKLVRCMTCQWRACPDCVKFRLSRCPSCYRRVFEL